MKSAALLVLVVCWGVVQCLRVVPMATKKAVVRPSSFNVTMDSDFAVRFFYQLLSSNDVSRPTNILFSPLSIVTTLAALAEGANGSTAAELYRSLNVNPWASSAVRHSMAHTLNLLTKTNNNYVLSIANRMYVQKDYRLLPHFEQGLRTYYRMNVERLSFEYPTQAEARINSWVSQVTNGHITSLIPPGTLDTLTRLVLTNAVYFKGEWETMFDEGLTRLMTFHVTKERRIQVPTMYVEAAFPYHNFERLGFEMVELAYAGGPGEVSMFVVLPYHGQTLATVARRLRYRPHLLCRRLRRLQALNNVEVTVLLPKFKLQHSVELKEALMSMGVREVFDQAKADLSRLSGKRDVHVSDALHKAAVEVNERGTKAAAASAVLIKGRSMSTDPIFRADRPFIFFIRHNPSSSILFMGAVNDFHDVTSDDDNDEQLYDN